MDKREINLGRIIRRSSENRKQLTGAGGFRCSPDRSSELQENRKLQFEDFSQAKTMLCFKIILKFQMINTRWPVCFVFHKFHGHRRKQNSGRVRFLNGCACIVRNPGRVFIKMCILNMNYSKLNVFLSELLLQNIFLQTWFPRLLS